MLTAKQNNHHQDMARYRVFFFQDNFGVLHELEEYLFETSIAMVRDLQRSYVIGILSMHRYRAQSEQVQVSVPYSLDYVCQLRE